MQTTVRKLIDEGIAQNEQHAKRLIAEADKAFEEHMRNNPGPFDVADRHDFFEARWGFDPEAHKKEALP